MEASVILLNSTARQFPRPLHPLQITPILKLAQKSFLSPSHYQGSPISLRPASLLRPLDRHSIICANAPVPPQGCHPSTPFEFFNTLSSSQVNINPLFSSSTFFRIFSDPKRKSFEWNHAQDGIHKIEHGVLGEKGPIITAVILGWLGSETKHLKKYVEFYTWRGINAITFVVSVKDVLSFDLGKKLEDRISSFTHELSSWLSESEKDGRERFLIFHTFSNTGWHGYGAILDNLLSKPELLDKIKGCVVDSGGDPNIDPKVWAAGFSAALLKKSSSSIYPSVEAGDRNALKNGGHSKIPKPLFIETMLLTALEKLFSFLLNLPDVNRRLSKVISTLSKNQPLCPQLYLYSTADKVIPYESVESFIEEQRRSGKDVHSFNFRSSPHVDHYRSFPQLYSSELEKFLNKCLFMVKDGETLHK